MSEAEENEAVAPAKKSKKGLMIGLILAVFAGGGGFFATYSGAIQGISGGGGHGESHHDATSDSIAFVPIEAITVSYPGPPERLFRFAAQLEVGESSAHEVEKMMPRVLDVLNGFLRALDPTTLNDRTAWYDLRLKMLYRVRMVLGEDKVRDLLITEFILH